MRLSSLFLDSQRSHKKRKTSSVSSSNTSTWSRYQSALIMLSSCRILILKICPRSTASIVNLSTWGDWWHNSIRLWFCVFLYTKAEHRWLNMVTACVLSYRSPFKLVAVGLWLSQFPLPCVPEVTVNGEEDVGVSAGSIHITCHHRHFVRVSCRGGDDKHTQDQFEAISSIKWREGSRGLTKGKSLSCSS